MKHSLVSQNGQFQISMSFTLSWVLSSSTLEYLTFELSDLYLVQRWREWAGDKAICPIGVWRVINIVTLPYHLADQSSKSGQGARPSDEPSEVQRRRVDVLLNEVVKKFPPKVFTGKVQTCSIRFLCPVSGCIPSWGWHWTGKHDHS